MFGVGVQVQQHKGLRERNMGVLQVGGTCPPQIENSHCRAHPCPACNSRLLPGSGVCVCQLSIAQHSIAPIIGLQALDCGSEVPTTLHTHMHTHTCTDAHKHFIYCCVLQGLTYTDAPHAEPEAWAALQSDSTATQVPGGESLDELRERLTAAVLDLARSHPGVFACVV